MAEFAFSLVEVFSRTPMSGNLLPVIHGADAVDTSTMALIARRFLQPETSFLAASDDPWCDYTHRIFTVAREVPFAGHPSLGAAAAHVWHAGLGSTELTQQTMSGRQRLVVESAGDEAMVAIAQNSPVFGATVSSSHVLAALGVAPEDAHPELPAQIVSTGLPALILPLREVSALAHATLDRDSLYKALEGFAEPDSLNCYLVAEEGPGRWRSRCFALDFTTGEDPATGSAAGAFGAYLREHAGQARMTIDQGMEMGFPSQIIVDVSGEIMVSGLVRFFGKGMINLPSH
ncbi:PhzF family phenazine biosynthesis protein [Nonomuraea sp. NPDC003707]